MATAFPFRSACVGLLALLGVIARGDEKSLRADVTMLAETIGPRSVFQSDSLKRSADYIVSRFEAMGWTVKRLGFPAGGITCENIEVERRGSKKPDEILVIGAHYDSVPSSPGADDNASGVAALLALAESLEKFSPSRTLRLVAFPNEEPIYFQTALMGSRVYARAPKERGDRIVAMVSVESVGYFSDERKSQRYPSVLRWFYPSQGNFVAVVSNRDSKALVKRVAKAFTSGGTLPVVQAALPAGLPGVGWSDHWAFWQEGYPAVMITDTATFRNPHYHRASDLPATLDYVRLNSVVRGLRATVDALDRMP
ncbi:MAG TPA: M20/M25/M40 family metallo-hydrolase [Opitutaceae bacterium]|nr:M20/M25/M40 family metallo-hydrolase [Opitutaceae bacterium]